MNRNERKRFVLKNDLNVILNCNFEEQFVIWVGA